MTSYRPPAAALLLSSRSAPLAHAVRSARLAHAVRLAWKMGRAGVARVLQRRVVPAAMAAILLASAPAPAGAQTLGPLLEAIRQGGSWVSIPIDRGRGSVETAAVPTMGLQVEGCARVWHGHSGMWRITAKDVLSDSEVTAVIEPDQPVRFRHRSGTRARLSVDVRWSEPRDTTLFLWVGLGGPDRDVGDACQPYTGKESR